MKNEIQKCTTYFLDGKGTLWISGGVPTIEDLKALGLNSGTIISAQHIVSAGIRCPLNEKVAERFRNLFYLPTNIISKKVLAPGELANIASSFIPSNFYKTFKKSLNSYIPSKVAEQRQCDCGAVVAKTTHARWCSIK